MNISKIYEFSSKFTRGEVDYVSIDNWDWPCSLETLARLGGKIKSKLYVFDMLQMGSYDGIPFPLDFRHERGKRYYDILSISAGHPFLVSDRFLEILEMNKFTGWKSYPIRLFEKDGREVFGYNGFSITGIAGKIDWDQSEIVQIPGPIDESITYSYYKGIPIDMSKWDGSDLFLAEGYWSNFITERVYKVLKNKKITNARFEKITESLHPVK